MRKYVILTDTGCDLNKDLRDKFDIEYLPMHLAVDGVCFDADLDWIHLSAKDFYQIMRDGNRYT